MVWFLVGLASGLLVAAVVARRRGASVPASVAEVGLGTGAEDAPLRPALEALPLGVIVFDDAGRESMRNSAAALGTGLLHADLIVESAIERLAGVASTGSPGEEEIRLAGPPARVLDIRARPLAGGGGIVTVEDVTERSRLDAVRTDFVANVSHELRTPVGAVSVLAETIEGETDDEVVLRLVRRMIEETDRMRRTIDDLLELSRIEMGGEALVSRIDLSVVARDVVERYSSLASRAGVALGFGEPTGPSWVEGDAHQLASAVGNLVENAVKYSSPGGTVLVHVRPEGGHVVVEVADQGIGIPAASLDRIFERFYRVDRARSRETGGTGLGLAIVRNIVNNHGGEVNVTSREGEGSTFTLRFPGAPGSAAPMMVVDERGDALD